VLAQPELGYELKSSQYEMVGADNREWVAELALAATPANEPLGFPHDELTVTCRPNPAIGLCLPVQLKETIVDNDAEQRVDATATFTKWRILPRTAGIVRVP
jgi:hypothetical protein